MVLYSLLFAGNVLALLIPFAQPGSGQETWGMVWLRFALTYGGFFLGIAALVSTMRAHNGYRGLHERLSGTWVVEVPRPHRKPEWPARRAGPELTQPAGLPVQIGPFVIKGALAWTQENKVLAGQDPVLERDVWIWLRPDAASPLSAARRDLNRATRLRWLACGRQGEAQWDAFLAAAGCPWREALATQAPKSWSSLRAVFTQLAEELAEAAKGKTLPAVLAIDQVWLQDSGGVILLDIPLQPVDAAKNIEATEPERSLALLREVAATALNHVPASDKGRRACRIPVPLHAQAVLNRLFRVDDAYPSVTALAKDLQAIRMRPGEVTRARRAAQQGILALLLFGGVPYLFLILTLIHLLLAMWPVSVALGDYAIPRAVTAMLVALTCAVGSALLTRGGLSLAIAGIGVVDRRGQRASRLRCAWRTLLTCFPFLVLLLAFPWQAYTGSQTGTYVVSWATILIVYFVSAVVAICFPRRSLHDLFAGTSLVPK
jgi:uncharacterized RDD family membrane protein YckC